MLAIAFACLAAFYLHNVMLAVLFAFIFSVAGAEYRNLLRQEAASAYMAEMARRVTIIPVKSDFDDQPPPPRLIVHGPN